MKSVNELLDDLAQELYQLQIASYRHNIGFNKAEQLVGQIRYAYQYRCGPDES
jgi:hypothetical protein